MPDAIDILTVAFVNTIKPVTIYTVWNRFVPNVIHDDAYIVVTAATGSSDNVKQRRIERISITVCVFAKSTDVNIDAIAGDVKNSIVDIYNNLRFSVSGNNFKVSYLTHSDNAPQALQFPTGVSLARYITFNFEVISF